MKLDKLENIISDNFEIKEKVGPKSDKKLIKAINETIDLVDSGKIRVANKVNGSWVVNQWIKKAILLSFRVNKMTMSKGPYTTWYDKVPGKTVKWKEKDWKKAGYRHVPNGVVRRGSYIAKNVVLMPSFVNLGAYVDEGTMIDTWASVGSCAQVGKNCHISGGAGIGGVLEPLQAGPVIIEDNCFVGARSEIAEGVLVEEGAVISMGVYIGASTKIVDRSTGEITFGKVPAYSVVVPGSLPNKSNPDGPSLYCAVIVKKVDSKTRSKTSINELTLAKELIKFPSVTPKDAGAIGFLATQLKKLGFDCKILEFKDKNKKSKPIKNIYARLGKKGPNLCYAGHTDVVPPGNIKDWTVNPFKPTIKKNHLIGRGANDMKSSIACFVSAVEKFLKKRKKFNGSISLLITGDEEGLAINGTKKVIDYLKKRREKIDFCIVGEPTNPNKLGEMIKIGRRGSISGTIMVSGSQGHVAYPHLSNNPINTLVKICKKLNEQKLDKGNKNFQPSNLEFTSINVDNKATNVIPATAKAQFNIRFNNFHTSSSLKKKIYSIVKSLSKKSKCKFKIDFHVSGESFLTKPNKTIYMAKNIIKKITKITPVFSTTGGTSDARFIRKISPCLEFGLVNKTMHKIDECVSLKDLKNLTKIYQNILEDYFK